MNSIYTQNIDNIIYIASLEEEEFSEQHQEFLQEPLTEVIREFFEKEHWDGYDYVKDEYTGRDDKALKKILRGTDLLELLPLALDYGRLIGRAEQLVFQKEREGK